MTEPTYLPLSDDDLADAARAGDDCAFEALYERHKSAATRVARLVVDPVTAEDVVAESFRKLLERLRAGEGPSRAVRPYLMQMVRNGAIDVHRRGHEEPVDPTSTSDPERLGGTVADPANDAAERAVIRAAFATLPDRWRRVLWLTSVEQLDRDHVARRMRLSPTAVSTIAHRARERLRAAYLEQHTGTTSDPACAETRELLGAYVRGTASVRDQFAVRRHIHDCDDCAAVVARLVVMNDSLGAVLLPAVAAPHLLAGVGAWSPPALWSGLVRRFRSLNPVVANAAVVVSIGVAGVVGVSQVVGIGRANEATRPAARSTTAAAPAPKVAAATTSVAAPTTTAPRPEPAVSPASRVTAASAPTHHHSRIGTTPPSPTPSGPSTGATATYNGPLVAFPSLLSPLLPTHVTVPVVVAGTGTTTLVLDVPGLTGFWAHHSQADSSAPRRRGSPWAPWSCTQGTTPGRVVCTLSGVVGRAYLGIDLGYAVPTTLTAALSDSTASVALP